MGTFPCRCQFLAFSSEDIDRLVVEASTDEIKNAVFSMPL